MRKAKGSFRKSMCSLVIKVAALSAAAIPVAVGCGRVNQESVHAAHASTANAASVESVRCTDLPTDFATRPATDCSKLRNSDGTLKRLPDAPPGERGRIVLFHYDDFGPHGMAHNLLGSEWWSWDRGGSFEPCDEFDVRVVVEEGGATGAPPRRYPTVKGASDYRLVDRESALRYLDSQSADL